MNKKVIQIPVNIETLPPEALALVEPLAFLLSLVLGQDTEIVQVSGEQKSDQEVEEK